VPPEPGRAWSATIAAAMLRRGAMVHTASLVMTMAALLGLVFAAGSLSAWLPVGGTILILGMVEFWLAARVALDAELFEAIAAKEADLDGFDDAMQSLGLMPRNKAKRNLDTRIRATFRLLKVQVVMLGLQVGVLVIAALRV
jgi:hypothetical protein